VGVLDGVKVREVLGTQGGGSFTDG
jgi:hypothetical protein